MLHRLPILLSLTFAATTAQAECSCLWQGGFADVHSNTDLVISGSVVASKGNSIDLALRKVMNGSEHQETIRVWLQTGDLCRPEASSFPPGSDWVMALHKITEEPADAFNPHTPNVSYGRTGDYSLSNCGGYWLHLNDNLVTGNLIDAPRWEYDPNMSPVLLSLIEAYVDGEIERSSLRDASRKDPALRELMLDTKAFLREEN